MLFGSPIGEREGRRFGPSREKEENRLLTTKTRTERSSSFPSEGRKKKRGLSHLLGRTGKREGKEKSFP